MDQNTYFMKKSIRIYTIITVNSVTENRAVMLLWRKHSRVSLYQKLIDVQETLIKISKS